MKSILLILALSAISHFSQADSFSSYGMENNSSRAMFLLNHPDQREQYIRQSAQMHEADQTLRELAGSEITSNNIYGLAAEIYADLLQRSGGDPDLLLQLLMQAKQNPEAFANQLSEEQKRRLSDLAIQVEQNRQ